MGYSKSYAKKKLYNFNISIVKQKFCYKKTMNTFDFSKKSLFNYILNIVPRKAISGSKAYRFFFINVFDRYCYTFLQKAIYQLMFPLI